MKIKRMPWLVRTITFNWPTAICLAPIAIYIKDRYMGDRITENHEKIHWVQQLEMYAVAITLCLIAQLTLLFFGIYAWWLIIFVVIPFAFYYAWYLLEYLIRIPFNIKEAYRRSLTLYKIWYPRKRLRKLYLFFSRLHNLTYQSIAFEREANEMEDVDDYLTTRKRFSWMHFYNGYTKHR